MKSTRVLMWTSNFLPIFNYPLLRGNKASVLLAPNSVVLTEATAIKYFGGVEQAMGKSIYIDNDIKGSTLQVTGILKNVPANSHLHFDLLLPIENSWTVKWDSRRRSGDILTITSIFNWLTSIKPDAATLHRVEAANA